jgi:hypothetical protein
LFLLTSTVPVYQHYLFLLVWILFARNTSLVSHIRYSMSSTIITWHFYGYTMDTHVMFVCSLNVPLKFKLHWSHKR